MVSYVCECTLFKCGPATHRRRSQFTESVGDKFQKTTNICKACRNCQNRKERNVLASAHAAHLVIAATILDETLAQTRAEGEEGQWLLLLRTQPVSVNHGVEDDGGHQEQHDARGAEGDDAVARRPRLLCFLLARVLRFGSHSVESRAERK